MAFLTKDEQGCLRKSLKLKTTAEKAIFLKNQVWLVIVLVIINVVSYILHSSSFATNVV